jgi:hypothetical protein
MSYYNPDRWVVLKLPVGYKVLGGWAGGYLDGSSWRLNSGITRVEKKLDWKDDEYFVFYGHTGSEYWCHPEMYGFLPVSAGVYAEMTENNLDDSELVVEVMPADTDWMNMKWEC